MKIKAYKDKSLYLYILKNLFYLKEYYLLKYKIKK